MVRPFLLSWEKQDNRWVYFLFFIVFNAAITFLPLPADLSWLLVAVELALPVYLAFRFSKGAPGGNPIYSTELWKRIPPTFLLGGLALALFLRFYKLATLFDWPTGDESWNGTLALKLSRQWTWTFFCTTGQAPPLPVWTSALLLKLGLSPALSLWIPSALASTFMVILGYLAARRFFSKSFAAVCGSLLAFSFWPLYIGHFAHQGIWLPVWACGCFYLLGRFLKSPPASRGKEAVFLGLAVGLGSFTFTPWPVAALLVGVTAFWKDRKGFPLFLFAFMVALTPFLGAALAEGYGHHISAESAWNSHFSWERQAKVIGEYFAALLWGKVDPQAAYAPTGGGFLNPLLSSFFLIGCLELVALRRRTFSRWIGPAFLLLLLPGLLSSAVETFRIAQVLPLLLLVTALGFYSLLSSLPKPARIPLFLLFLSVSTLFDLDRLLEPYRHLDLHHPAFAHGKSLERFRAFEVLSDRAQKEGPGLIFTDFDSPILTDFDDSSLPLMTYPFNAVLNPGLEPAKTTWAAVYVNIHYQPFLSKRFPDFQWYWVANDLHRLDGGELLGIVPVTAQNRPVFERWFRAHRAFHQLEIDRFFRTDGNLDPVIRTLDGEQTLVAGDPFLESAYWEKRAAYEYRMGHFEEVTTSYQKAVTQGYPAGHLWYNLGELLALENRYAEARQAFLGASQAPLSFPSKQTPRNDCDFPIPPR